MKNIKTFKSFLNEGVDRVRDLSELYKMEDWIKSFHSKIEILDENDISEIYDYIESHFDETVLEIIENYYSADKLHYYQDGNTVATGGIDTGDFIEDFDRISTDIDEIVKEYTGEIEQEQIDPIEKANDEYDIEKLQRKYNSDDWVKAQRDS